MDFAEWERLQRGDFRKGDFIRDKTMPTVGGWIVGKGTLGRMRGLFWRVETPRGDMFIPVEDAI